MIYLDNSATTRVCDKAAQKASYMMTECFSNPSSLHKFGFEAEMELKNAKRIICSALECREGELYFTSGGTESNNTAVIGTAMAQKRLGNRIVVSSIEHSSVISAAKYLEKFGFEVAQVLPDKSGIITPEAVAEKVDEKTVLVSVMLVNNEIGSVMDIATVAAAARRKNPKVTVHCDAVQAFGKIPVRTGRLGVDLLSVSAHKINALKGTGALFVKKGTRINPIIYGGEQQNGFRPGTENSVGIAAFGAACTEAVSSMSENYARVKKLRDMLSDEISKIDGFRINSSPEALPYIFNFSTGLVRSETLMHFLEQKEIYVSSGSACAKGHKSHVLTALGLPDKMIDTAIRVSFGKDNTEADITAFVSALKDAVNTLQKI